MNLRKAIYFCILTAISLNNINGTERIYDLAKMGLKANSSKMQALLCNRLSTSSKPNVILETVSSFALQKESIFL